MRHRLRKAERVAIAPKGHLAQYVWGSKKRDDKVFGKGTIDSIAKPKGVR